MNKYQQLWLENHENKEILDKLHNILKEKIKHKDDLQEEKNKLETSRRYFVIKKPLERRLNEIDNILFKLNHDIELLDKIENAKLYDGFYTRFSLYEIAKRQSCDCKCNCQSEVKNDQNNAS